MAAVAKLVVPMKTPNPMARWMNRDFVLDVNWVLRFVSMRWCDGELDSEFFGE